MAPTKRPTQAVGYCRVSTEEQGKSALGLQAQEQAIRVFCEREGITLVRMYTEVESGGVSVHERPGLRSARTHARRMRAPVVVSRLDRLSRDVEDTAHLMKRERFLVAELGADVPDFLLHNLAAFACHLSP